MKIIRPTAVLDSGGSFSRTSTATYYNSAGILQTAAINIPRITYNPSTLAHVGLLLEAAATNILLNSATLSTQSVTSTAAAYTLSFQGTGTVTLTGTSTAGPLVGTSATNILSLTFTPTAGTLTLTVSGSVTRAQLELGSVATSYIPTTGTTVTRSADVVTGTGFIYSSLPEAAGTLLVKPETLATQNVTVSATPYTISFTGTGSIVLSGVGSGSLAGTGTSNRVSLTFTPTAGTLTITVTGSVKLAQLELGSTLSPYINETTWNPATSYTLGQQVVRTTALTHMIYENLIPGVSATLPELLPATWLEVGPTNRWGVFDDQVGTTSTALNSITYLLKPGRINSIALLEADASLVTMSLVLPTGEIVQSSSADLNSGVTVGDWYQYFYEPIYQQDSLVVTNLLDTVAFNLPTIGEATLAITLSKPSGTVSCGIIVVGLSADLGSTQNAPSIGIIDYSTKVVDTFGNFTITKRKYSKRMTVKLAIPSNTVDATTRVISQYRSTPLVWVGAENLYTSLIVYGFYRDFDITIDNIIQSTCNIQIEGLT